MARRSGNAAQFTYDFGIAIAQSTVNKVARLAGVSLSLAAAFYSLKKASKTYVDTLRQNTLRFGGVISTMRAMEQAQERLIKGQSYFSVEDQLAGYNKLMEAGINVKKNMDWINKAAHATGKSYAEFSGMIASAIQGNTGALVEAGLMTQRATRMFDKYEANTVMRQQAILNFVKNHKGLQKAIMNDFETIQDQITRLKGIWTAFLQEIMGKPNDPSSLYGQITSSLKAIAEAFARNWQTIKRYAYTIGQVLGWVVKQVGHFVVWLGGVTKRAIEKVWKVTDQYQEQAKSIVVWLEFWKLHLLDILKEYYEKVMDFYHKHETAIKTITKVALAYMGLRWIWTFTRAMIASAWAYVAPIAAIPGSCIKAGKALKEMRKLQLAYMAFMGPGGVSKFGKFGVWFQSLAAYMPRGLRRVWVSAGKGLNNFLFGSAWTSIMGWIGKVNGAIGGMFKGLGRYFGSIFKNLLNPKQLFGIIPMFKGLFKGIAGAGKGLFGAILGGGKGLFSGIGKGLKWIVGLFPKLLNGAKLFFGFLKNIPAIFSAIVQAGRALISALLGSNPVGWIILAIGLLVVMYKKCETFRIFVNNLFKFIWEALKFVWNLLVGIVVYTIVGIKKAWQWFKAKIWTPVANFFKNAYKWIGDMWKAFKNTSVGRFINKYIVQPIKTVFEYVVKAWKWVLKAIGKAVTWLAGANSDMAKNINRLAEEEGLSGLALATEGGTYDTNDSTDYLSFSNSAPEAPDPGGTGNPIINENQMAAAQNVGGGGGGGSTTNLDFSSGAIQIIVQKGEDIDERKLARMVREEIQDAYRNDNIRGGSI